MARQKAVRKKVLVGQDDTGNDIFEFQTELVDLTPGEEAVLDAQAQFSRRQDALQKALQSIDDRVKVVLNDKAFGWGDTREDLARFESLVNLIGTPVTAKPAVVDALAVFTYAKNKRITLSNPSTPVEDVEAYDAFNDGDFPT